MSFLSPNRSLWVALLAAAFLTLAILAQTAWFRATKSATFDETIYLSCALQTVHDGRLDSALVRMGTAPLPVMIHLLPVAAGQGGMNRPVRSQGELSDPAMIRAARSINAWSIGVPLTLVVFVWLWRRRGALSAVLGGGLCAFSPTVLAHASLATTDACFALLVLLSLAALSWLCEARSGFRFCLAALVIGAAISAKYTGLFLAPVAYVALALGAANARRVTAEEKNSSGKRWFRSPPLVAAWQVVGLMILALLVCWGFHQFAFVEVSQIYDFHHPRTPHWVRDLGPTSLPAPLVGMLSQYLHNVRGHHAFLLGELSMTPRWSYFPCAALVKSTPCELALGIGLLMFSASRLWAALKGRRRSPAEHVEPRPVDATTLICWSALIALTLVVVAGRIQIGQRYLLPLYPLVIILGVEALWTWSGQRSRRVAAIGGALLIGQIVSAAMIGPHYLAYFSPLIGGPSQGQVLLGDSNLDWGQDLPLLRQELDKLGSGRVALSYFGTALPEAHAIQAVNLNSISAQELREYDWLAVSVNHLTGLYSRDAERLAPLLKTQPTARAGYTIFIYDLRTLPQRE